MCYVEFDNEVSAYREELRKARKEHRCDGCGVRILPGEQYLSLFCVSDGEPMTSKTCKACDEIADRFAKEHHSGKPFPDGLQEIIENCIDEGDEDSLRWKVDLDAMNARRESAKDARA